MIRKSPVIFFVLITSIFLSTGCNSSPTPQQELDIQANFLPAMFRIDGNTYALANQTPPSDLTIEIFKSSLLKASMLRKYEKEAKNNFSLERNRNPVELNSLCLLTEFLLNKEYINEAKLNAQYYEDIYGWINSKNSTWKSLLKDTSVGSFDHPCVQNKSNIH